METRWRISAILPRLLKLLLLHFFLGIIFVSDDLLHGFAHAEKLVRIHLRLAAFKVQEVPIGLPSRWDRVKNPVTISIPDRCDLIEETR